MRASAVTGYIYAAVTDVDVLAGFSAGSASVLGSPINIADLDPLPPEGAPSWLPRSVSDPTPATPNGMVRFEDPELGPVFIKPAQVALVLKISPGVNQVFLNLNGGTQSIVLHLPIEQVHARLNSENHERYLARFNRVSRWRNVRS